MSGVIITLNQGDSPGEVEDSYEVGETEGYTFELTANQTVWITVLAYDEDPLAEFRI
jgi:hypothetical protein